MRTLALILAAFLPLAATAQSSVPCLRDTPWGVRIAPHEQRMEFELIERAGLSAIVGIRFSPLRGEYAKLFGFFLHDGSCVVRAYIVGAFASANEFQPVDTLGEPGTIHYNQDFYSDTTQARLALTDVAPSYEAAKQQALTLLRAQ